MTDFVEARRHQRFSVDIEATVTVQDLKLAARARDLSRSGICIITPEEVAGGTEIDIDLVLSFGDNAFSEPLKVTARVVWCTPLFGSYQVGAMFVGLDGERGRFLDMFLHFLDGTVTPEGMAPAEGGEEEELPEEPDDKDDPFRP